MGAYSQVGAYLLKSLLRVRAYSGLGLNRSFTVLYVFHHGKREVSLHIHCQGNTVK